MSESEENDVSLNGDRHDLSERRNKKLRSEFDSLEAEMEIAGYGTNNYNRSRRKISRSESKRRTIKRKSLEKIDKEVSAITSHEISRQKRIRGSKAALDDNVTMSSLVFNSKSVGEKKVDIHISDPEEPGHNDDEVSNNQSDVDEEEIYNQYEMLANDLDDSVVDEMNKDVDDENLVPLSEPSIKKSRKSIISNNYFGKSVAKTMYRLRNFSSQRMAEKHGDALGAHARGLNKTAVDKLQQVASAAPVAPQVYSSLGLVYENMLRDKAIILNNSNIDVQKVLTEQLILAKKTFASYHVAAVLCKMDYSLWVRAGDAATMIAHLHKSYLRLPQFTPKRPNLDDLISDEMQTDESRAGNFKFHQSNLLSKIDLPPVIKTNNDYISYHINEYTRWLEEAKEDYQTADNQRPPGIAVPAKLAKTHLDLGNLIEALTILTDLKNSSQDEIANNLRLENRSRTELEHSHQVWVLYADLMLAVGHECHKWNDGDQSTENYMLRRWLRKFSQSFDWKERRLQALCFALEAAAGSKSCTGILKYIKQRMALKRWAVQENYEAELKTHRDQPNINTEDSVDDFSNTALEIQVNDIQKESGYADDPDVNSSALDLIESHFQSERKELLDKNKKELSVFDEESKTAAEFPGSHDALERANQRALLIQAHKNSILGLAGKFHQKRVNFVKEQTKNNINESYRDDLVMSSGCATVFNIASELLQLLLSMELFPGGRLVVEAVSSYIKERADRFDNRRKQQTDKEISVLRGKRSLIQLDPEFYDDVNNDADEEGDEDSLMYLSDDDDFNSASGNAVICAMKLGILPPDLQLLYGICLLCSKDMDFLAKKMIESIEVIPFHVSNDDYFSVFDDTSYISSTKFFRAPVIEPIDKLKALELIAETLIKAGKLRYWSPFLTTYYSDFFQNIEGSPFIHLLESDPSTISKFKTIQRSRLLKVFLVDHEMKINCAKTMVACTIDESANSFQNGIKIIFEVLQSICSYKHAFWHLDSEGNPKNESIVFLKVTSSLCSIFLEYSEMFEAESLSQFIRMLNPLISLIFDISIPSIDPSEFTPPDLMRELWTDYPLPSLWQSPDFVRLSRIVRNLCIGSNVMAFSGWEKEDFSMRLLKRRDTRSYFGVRVKGSHVAGWLTVDQEVALEKQWALARSFLPNFRGEDFSCSLSFSKQSDWFKNSIAMKNEFDCDVISNLGEHYAIQILLAYSDCCLRCAAQERDKDKIDYMLQCSYSIILPMTQFCLDKIIWDIHDSMMQSDDNPISQVVLLPMVHEMEPSTYPISKNIHSVQRKSHTSRFNKSVEDLIKPLREPIIKLVKVPIDLMLQEWTSEDYTESEERTIQMDEMSSLLQNVKEHSNAATKRLDFNVSKIRKCTSITSLQKASLRVALSLLEISEMKGCFNPFLCLNHAAIFASYGPKGGNNDESFKRQLPKDKECTPEEALNILGRADCLRCLHFTKESMFLCSYVARVCCQHRDKTRTDMIWNSKWRVVGIFLYTISVCIDSVLTSLTSNSEDRRQALASWDENVRAEVGRCRSDAVVLCKANGIGGVFTPSQTEIILDDAHKSEFHNDCEYFDNGVEIISQPTDTSICESQKTGNMPQLFNVPLTRNANTAHTDVDSIEIKVVEI